ncbi:MAG: hypothetical protein WD063_15870 [Pirellulales bacterium]
MIRFPIPSLQRERASQGRRFPGLATSVLMWVSFCGAFTRAEVLPPPPIPVTLPLPAPNAFGVSVAFGPGDGLMYVWDGASVLKQDAPLATTYSSIGDVGSGSADAGPIAFSRDAGELLIGNGAGGLLGGSHAGLIFTIPSSGGDSHVEIATIEFHDNFLAAPLGISNHKFFVNQGNVSFSASSVSVLDNTDGTNVPVIGNIPGPSGGMAIHSSGRLFVGVGFGPQRGQLRSFPLSAVEMAYDTDMPLDWDDGEVFNSLDNNSGFGMFFDARGFLFAGGPNGVTVFDPEGNAVVYENNGFTGVVYDSLNDRVLVTGFGDHQGLYPSSLFVVPEPATAALALGFAVVLIPRWRRRLTSWQSHRIR